jgi:RNA polymerase sigma-70 factor (ECF subfamily)
VGLDEVDTIEDQSSTPEEAFLRKKEKEELMAYVKLLPAAQQQAIVLRYLQNCTYREISEIMDKTEGSVKQLLHRGLTSLRERMMNHD